MTGRPTKYDPDYCRQAIELLSVHGFAVEHLAVIWGVNKTSIYEWRKKHPEFAEALQQGKDLWNCASVEKALHKRATGYNYTESTIEYMIIDGKKVPTSGKEVKKQVAPDTRAQQFFLQSRNPRRWPALNQKVKVEASEEMTEVLKDLAGKLPE